MAWSPANPFRLYWSSQVPSGILAWPWREATPFTCRNTPILCSPPFVRHRPGRRTPPAKCVPSAYNPPYRIEFCITRYSRLARGPRGPASRRQGVTVVSTAQQISFGIIHGFHGFDLAGLAEEARHAESLGYDVFSMPDHLHTDQPTAEPWTALTWVAAATQRLRVLPNVLGLPYRAPAVTAKMAETLDRLSGGRLILRLGLGGYDAEFSAFGLAQRTPGQKLAALREAVTVIRGVWSEQNFSFEGEHFAVRDARIEPT